jgi:hypothetical protein
MQHQRLHQNKPIYTHHTKPIQSLPKQYKTTYKTMPGIYPQKQAVEML